MKKLPSNFYYLKIIHNACHFLLISGERHLFASRSVLSAKRPSYYSNIENEATSVERVFQTSDRGSLSTFGLIRLNTDLNSIFISIGNSNVKKDRHAFASHSQRNHFLHRILVTPQYFYYIIFFTIT